MQEPQYYLIDVEELNSLLKAAVDRCIFKVNGLCQSGCPLVWYCGHAGGGKLIAAVTFVDDIPTC